MGSASIHEETVRWSPPKTSPTGISHPPSPPASLVFWESLSSLLVFVGHLVRCTLLKPLLSLFNYLCVMFLTDADRLKTLSSPIVQIRLEDNRESYALTHAPSVHYRAHPFCWTNTNAASTSALLPDTLFYMQFASTADPKEADRFNLSLGVTPNNWLFVEHDTGHISLTSDVSIASLFTIPSASTWDRQKPQSYTISLAQDDYDDTVNHDTVDYTLGFYKQSRRASFVNLDSHTSLDPHDFPVQATVTLQNVPLFPTLNIPDDLNVDSPSTKTNSYNNSTNGSPSNSSDLQFHHDGDSRDEHLIKNDCDITMAQACENTRSVHVRLYNVGKRAFLVSKPDCPLRAASVSDQGWDIFRLDSYPNVRTGRLFDAYGTPLQLTLLEAKPSKFGLMGGKKSVATHDLNEEGEFMYIDMLRLEDRNEKRANVVTLRTRKGYLSMNSVSNRQPDVSITADKNGANEEWRLYLALPSDIEMRVPRVSVTMLNKGIRQIRAEIQIRTSLDLAYDVITDYDGFKNFLDDVSDSAIVERLNATNLTVRMVQCHSFLMLTIPMAITMRVRQYPDQHKVDLELVSGMGIRHYRGTWSAAPVKQGDHASKQTKQLCHVSCVLEVAPIVPAPGFLIDGLISHTTAHTLKQLKDECDRREQ